MLAQMSASGAQNSVSQRTADDGTMAVESPAEDDEEQGREAQV